MSGTRDGEAFDLVVESQEPLTGQIEAVVRLQLAVGDVDEDLGPDRRPVAGRGLDVGLTATMTAACLAGAIGAAALAGRVPQRALARAFAGLVAVVVAFRLVSAVFLGGPPGGA